MDQASIPLAYWDHIFDSIVFIINRLPSAVLQFKSPYELLFSRQPNFFFFKVLGCLCYPWLRLYAQTKLNPRSLPCIFLGYSSLHKGYKCLHLPTNRVYIFRHVVFHESTFPFSSSSFQPISTSQPSSSPSPNFLTIIPVPTTPSLPASSTPSLSTSQSPPLSPPPHSPPPASSSRTHQMTTRTRDNTRLQRKFPDFVTYTASPSFEQEPTCFTQAKSSSEWHRAMALELDALAQHNTWKLVPPPEHHHIVGCK